MQREFTQDLLPLRRKLQVHLAAIFVTALAAYKSGSFQPVHQLDRAVVLDLQALGNFRDLGTHMQWQPLKRKKKLVLARLKTCLARRPLAEP